MSKRLSLPDNFGVQKFEPDAVDSSLKTNAITPAKTIRQNTMNEIGETTVGYIAV